MKTMSSELLSGFNAKTISPAIFVELFLDEGTTRLWSGCGYINYNGNQYTGTGNFGSISTLESDGTSINGLSMTLSGVPIENLSIALGTEYRNRPANIHIILFNDSGNMIGGYQAFSALIDKMELTRDGENSTITINVETELLNLDRARLRYYTNTDQRNFVDPNDYGFEYLPAISKDITFNWGKSSTTMRSILGNQ